MMLTIATAPNTVLIPGPETVKRPPIRVATEPSEIALLFEFRYRIYVEEMQRKQKYADHVRKRIRDPLDDFGTNLIACDCEGNIIGAVRVNFARDSDLHGYEEFYAMDSVGDAHPNATSICTRMMVAPEYRKSTLAVRLSVAAYEFGLPKGITHNFIDCNEHLIALYQGLGFVQHLPKRNHEEYGSVTCMRMSVRDKAHLQRLHSPFLASLVRWEQSATSHHH